MLNLNCAVALIASYRGCRRGELVRYVTDPPPPQPFIPSLVLPLMLKRLRDRGKESGYTLLLCSQVKATFTHCDKSGPISYPDECDLMVNPRKYIVIFSQMHFVTFVRI